MGKRFSESVKISKYYFLYGKISNENRDTILHSCSLHLLLSSNSPLFSRENPWSFLCMMLISLTAGMILMASNDESRVFDMKLVNTRNNEHNRIIKWYTVTTRGRSFVYQINILILWILSICYLCLCRWSILLIFLQLLLAICTYLFVCECAYISVSMGMQKAQKVHYARKRCTVMHSRKDMILYWLQTVWIMHNEQDLCPTL